MIRHALYGIGNEHPEITRIIGAAGGFAYVFGPLIFQAWALGIGQTWDPAAFCAAYGGGLALAATGVGAMIAIKDRGVAKAKAECGKAA